MGEVDERAGGGVEKEEGAIGVGEGVGHQAYKREKCTRDKCG